MTPIAISIGAIAGALLRYYLTIGIARRMGASFPFGTFIINLSGALLMGFCATLAVRQGTVSAPLKGLVLTGFLGSYTTFSTFALDTTVLLRGKRHRKALLYWAGSVLIGGLGLELGVLLAGVVR